MKHADRAEQYYSNNFNWSQAVFTTFATDHGLNEDIALKIATTFGLSFDAHAEIENHIEWQLKKTLANS